MPGLGAAYGTTCRDHLLNVRANNMSAYADMPDHFVRWAQQNYSSLVAPDDFLPRPVYGEYIASQIRDASRSREGELRCIQGTAISLSPLNGRSEIGLAGGQTLTADKVALAFGHFPPADLPLPGKSAGSGSFISNPWVPGALSNVEKSESVLLIGSGLTSVDITLELRARGVKGTIHIFSRRGLLPQRHAPAKIFSCQTQNLPRTARGLLRMVRLRC